MPTLRNVISTLDQNGREAMGPGVLLFHYPDPNILNGSLITVDNESFFSALAALGFFMALAVILNMLPVPGLDGFGIIRPWLPYSIQYSAMRFATVGVYGVFIALWFVAPVRTAFFHAVFQLTALANIDPTLVSLGLLNMRFF